MKKIGHRITVTGEIGHEIKWKLYQSNQNIALDIAAAL